MERALGPHLDHPAVADLLTRYPTPQALMSAGRGHVRARLEEHAPRAAERLTEAIFTTLDQQTAIVVGTSAAGITLPKSSPSNCWRCAGNAMRSPPRSKPSWRPTLFTRS